MSSTFVRIGRFVLDVSLDESHTFEADVTEFPSETGATLTDNIRPKPIKVSVTGIVSDSPLGSNADNSASIADLPPGTLSLLRSAQAFEYLKSIWESRDVVDIRTSIGTFDNMAMTSFDIPRSKETTGGLKFTASFQQIQKVSNLRQQRKRTSTRTGKGRKERGEQAGDPWVVIPVVWNKGKPPGSTDIYATETIDWRVHPVAASAAGQTPTTASATATVVVNSGKEHGWYHQADARNAINALTDSELAAFKLDSARDRRIEEQLKHLTFQPISSGRAIGIALGEAPPTKTASQELQGQFNKAIPAGKANATNPDFKDKSTFKQGSFDGKPTAPPIFKSLGKTLAGK